ncbi:hypothetical protein ACC691_37000, partial [Rhizobium johnstonii]|uniref:hypothetical protein n=1 Tax=Rhizobium johnstonii TaxID=3019933 RepID=UPI003F984F06
MTDRVVGRTRRRVIAGAVAVFCIAVLVGFQSSFLPGVLGTYRGVDAIEKELDLASLGNVVHRVHYGNKMDAVPSLEVVVEDYGTVDTLMNRLKDAGFETDRT